MRYLIIALTLGLVPVFNICMNDQFDIQDKNILSDIVCTCTGKNCANATKSLSDDYWNYCKEEKTKSALVILTRFNRNNIGCQGCRWNLQNYFEAKSK